MVVLGDLRPIFYATRFMGCGYHVVMEDDIKLTKRGIIYTSFCAFAYLASAIRGMLVLAENNDTDPKLLMLIITRTTLSYACLLVDIILTLKWNWKVRAAFSEMRNFDRAMRFNVSRKRNRNQILSLLLVISILIFWVIVGYLTFESEPSAALFNGLMYGLVNAAMSTQILSFLCIAFLLRERFRSLCEILLSSEAEGKKVMVMVVESVNKQFRLQEIWWLHCSLANAMETINSVYTTQLLLWISCMSFNTLSRIYTINETRDIPVLLKIRESLLVTACASNLLLITVICHTTATQANRVGRILFSPLSFVVGKRNFLQDNVEAAAYFQLRKVHFFAASGLIRVDLPLLLSIASGITTYLVILHAGNGS